MISFYIAWFFRLLTEDICLPMSIIFGLIFFDKKLFKNAFLLFLTGILFNYALKITFQIPLNPDLNIQGFSFPSGHGLSRFVIYSFLAYHILSYHYLKWTLYSILMLGNRYYLMFFGFHHKIDIFASYFTGCILLMFYLYLMKQTNKIFFFTLFSFNTALITYMSFSGFPYLTQFLCYFILISTLILQFFENNKAYYLTFFSLNTAFIIYVTLLEYPHYFPLMYYCILVTLITLQLFKPKKTLIT